MRHELANRITVQRGKWYITAFPSYLCAVRLFERWESATYAAACREVVGCPAPSPACLTG